MKIFLCFFIVILFSLSDVFSQTEAREESYSIPDSVPTLIDSLYREDQFYIGLSFNLLDNKPSTISQASFSGGFHAGFIRDFPLNERRNIALGVGLGWALDTYGQNLFIGQDNNGETIFRSLQSELEYETNRFTTQIIEAPVEFRWRSSTAATYKFWRVYTGLRFGYLYNFKSNFVQPGNQVIQRQVNELDRIRLGANFTFGYSTFNFHFYYSLNPLFENASLDGEALKINPVRIGLTFYIL